MADLQPNKQMPPREQAHGREQRVLVGIGAGMNAKSVLRAAHTHAARMESQLLVVSIESPEDLSDRERQTRAETLNLARQLGAEVVLASGSNVGRALLGVARERGISLLVLGKPQNSSAIPFRRRESPVRWLERNADGIPLLLVPAEAQVSEHQDGTFASSLEPKETRRREYLGAALMAIPATVLGLLFEQVLGYWSVALIYLLTVTLTGVSFGRGPTVMLATLCAALWDLVFIPPRFTLYIGHPQDLLMFFMFFAVALAVGHLTTRLRQRERLERRMELRATALYQLTRKLAAATSLEEVISAGCSQTERVFQASVVIALRNADGGLSATLGVSNAWIPLPGEFEVMLESFEEKRAIEGAGASAKGDRLLCLPLLVAGGVEGVLGLRLPGGYFLDANHRELLDAFAAQMGIVSEIQRIAKERRSSELLADSARLQKTLFDSVSHELKTPIAAIRVALEQPAVSAEEIRRATDRLHRAVEQLLSATRIESGLLKPNREWCDPADLANEAIVLAQGGAEIRLTAAEPLPLMRVDAGLVVQSLVSLLENALTHGASDQGPEVFVSSDAASVRFEVADRGRGIPPGAENRVFEKFHRLPGASAGGIGLGLAIAKQFSELLGGELRACNREGGGVSFFLTLPVGGRVEFPA